LGLAGDGGNALSFLIGANQIDFGGASGLVPTADGGSATAPIWYMIGASKATGTVSPVGYMMDLQTGVMTTATAAGTSANRTAGTVSMNIGSFAGGDYWDGRIAMCGVYERILRVDEFAELGRSRMAWYGNMKSQNDDIFDLTWRTNNFLSWKFANNAFSTGTAATFAPGCPPGWM
jgi:hypothetical protein